MEGAELSPTSRDVGGRVVVPVSVKPRENSTSQELSAVLASKLLCDRQHRRA
jgi:hypothetical protein